jgi:hypothetical protein
VVINVTITIEQNKFNLSWSPLVKLTVESDDLNSNKDYNFNLNHGSIGRLIFDTPVTEVKEIVFKYLD